MELCSASDATAKRETPSEGWSCERRLPKDGPVRDAFTSVLRETVSLLTSQEGASVRLGMRTPESGANSRERSKRVGTSRGATNPKTGGRPAQGTAGTNRKTGEVPSQVLVNLDLNYCVSEVSLWRSPTACRRSVGSRLPFSLLEVVA